MGGCFLGWFLSSKRRKRSNSGSPRRKIDGGNVTSGDRVVCAPGKGTNLVAESSEKCVEGQLSLHKQKRVTFDSNVETFEHVPFYGSTDSLVESNNVVDDGGKNEEAIGDSSDSITFSVGDAGGENEEAIGDSSDSITFSVGDTTIPEVGSYPQNNVVDDGGKNEEGFGDSSESITFSVGDTTISEVVSYPQNNRYQNCGDTDDDAIDCECEGSVVGDTDDDYDIKSDGEGMLCEEVWSEAITNVSLELREDMSLTGADLQEVNSPLESRTDMSLTGVDLQEVRSPLESRTDVSLAGVDVQEGNSPVVCSEFSENVLSPVENLNQRKAANSKGLQPTKAQEKENLAADGEAPRISSSSGPQIKESLSSCKPSSDHSAGNQSNDSVVESSLSNWLVSPDIKTRSGEETKNSFSRGSPSVRNIEDRPILGAWTQEEVKLFSASPSPRKSPRRNPDDMPIIGTVGTYWKHGNEVEDCGSATSCKKKNSGSPTSFKGIPNTTSKYREDKKIRWHSTPFEKRLEKALDGGGSEEA